MEPKEQNKSREKFLRRVQKHPDKHLDFLCEAYQDILEILNNEKERRDFLDEHK